MKQNENFGGAHVVFAMLERWAISFYKAWWCPMEEKWKVTRQGQGWKDSCLQKAFSVRFEEIGVGRTVGYSFPRMSITKPWGLIKKSRFCQKNRKHAQNFVRCVDLARKHSFWALFTWLAPCCGPRNRGWYGRTNFGWIGSLLWSQVL